MYFLICQCFPLISGGFEQYREFLAKVTLTFFFCCGTLDFDFKKSAYRCSRQLILGSNERQRC